MSQTTVMIMQVTFMISKGVPPSTSEPPLNLKPQAAWVPSLMSSTGTRKSTHSDSESTASDLSLKSGNHFCSGTNSTHQFSYVARRSILFDTCTFYLLLSSRYWNAGNRLPVSQSLLSGRVARRILRRESISSEKSKIEISSNTDNKDINRSIFLYSMPKCQIIVYSCWDLIGKLNLELKIKMAAVTWGPIDLEFSVVHSTH